MGWLLPVWRWQIKVTFRAHLDDVGKPLLLVDIDGVISLFGFDTARPPRGRFIAVEGIVHFLSEAAGDHLRRLAGAFELAWCSGWEEKAGEHLPAVLGPVARLPHVRFDGGAQPGAHWKLAAVETFAGPSRPLAWIDDAHDERTAAWAAARPGPTLLVSTKPAVGLTSEHVRDLLKWAARAEGATGPIDAG